MADSDCRFPAWPSNNLPPILDPNDTIVLVRNGDTIHDWREIVQIADTTTPSKLSPEETLNKWMALTEKKCPGAMERKVISKDETSVLFQVHTNPCRSMPEEAEIGRVILGKYSWYVLEYRARVHELAPDTRAQWIKTFSDATFDSVTSSFEEQKQAQLEHIA